MQFKIPQDVRIEDKLFAFVSIKQLFMMLGGGMIAYLVYAVAEQFYPPEIYAIPVTLIIGLTALITFFKIDNLTFLKLMLLFLERMINPSSRYWKHLPGEPNLLDVYKARLDVLAGKTEKKVENTRPETSLEELTKLVDIDTNTKEDGQSK